MEPRILHSLVTGSVAVDVLQASLQGQVTGQTSGGVFLRTDTDRILFLSFASWRGPLTINLSPADREDLHVDLHSPFLIHADSLYFPEEQIKIKFDRAGRWSPPSKPPELLPLAERVRRFAQVSTAVTAGLVDRFAAGRDSLAGLDAHIDPDAPGLPTLRKVLRSGEPGDLIAALVDGLGRGPGLTPAGDDLVLGFLLALNRWGDRLCSHLPQEQISRALVDAAHQRTTTLSANLIRCAAAGLADERLVLALDGLVSGNLAEDLIVDHLLGWGHTSGAAALQGMGLVAGLGEKK